MAKFTVHVSTGRVGSRIEDTFEVPDDELAGCGDDPTARDELIEEYAREVMFNLIEWGWLPVETP